MSDRADLEARASVLGLPWTCDTTDADLETLIKRAEVSGSLQALEPAPECLGLYWDPIFEQDCKTCTYKDTCKARFAAERVPKMLSEYDEDHDRCADESGISDAAWHVCFLAYLELEKGRLENERLAKGKGEGTPPVAAPKPPKKPSRRKPQPQELPMGQPVLEAPSWEAAESRPTQAGSAASAAGPAGKKKRARKRRPKSRAPLAQEPEGEWSLHTHVRRHSKERKKYPQLVPGTVLRRKYKGKLWELQVMEEGYLLIQDSRIYPTLYMTVKAIVGTVKTKKQKKPHHKKRPEGTRETVPYSGPVFWNLKSQERQLLLDAVSDSTSPEES